MSIGRKQVLISLGTIVALALVGTTGIVGLTLVKDQTDLIYHSNTQAMGTLLTVSQDYLKMEAAARDLLLTPDPDEKAGVQRRLTALDASLRTDLAAYRKSAGTAGEDVNRVLDSFEQTYTAYQDVLVRLGNLVAAGDQRKAVALLQDEGALKARDMSYQIDGLSIAMQTSASDRYERSAGVALWCSTATAIILVLATVYALVAALWLRGNIAKPIVTAAALAGRLSAGDLSVRSPQGLSRRRDEVGVLARAIDSLAESLTSFVTALQTAGTDLRQSAEDLDSRASEAARAAARIAETAQDGHALALEQAGGVQKTTSTVSEITSTIETFDRLIESQSAAVTESSASLEQMASNVKSLSHQASKLGEAFGELRGTSDDGRQKLYTVVGQFHAVAGQSSRLADANDTIRTIASQTNLLSMNAAIEAAHAGESGAGFAVVASEIRKLAEQAALRSKDITSEVKAIRSLIAQTTQNSETAQAAFDAIHAKVEELGAFEAELSLALVEQNQGAGQILEATAEVSTVTNEVRQGSLGILERSQSIQRQMEQLLDLSARLESSLSRVTDDGKAILEASAGVQSGAARSRALAEQIGEVAAAFRTGEVKEPR